MTTVANFTCNKDSRTAVSGGTNLGAGVGNGLPYGAYSGYTYRSFLGFSINMAGWTGINYAILHYRTSNQIYIAFGSDPTFDIARVTTAWSEGSSSSMSASNAIVYPGPTAAGVPVISDAPTAENTWGAADITQIMRDVLGGAAFTGLRLRGVNNDGSQATSATQTGEIYSRESGSAAYIEISYETNRPPDAPTIASTDVDGTTGLTGLQSPALKFTLTDPDGNNLAQYRWQIDDNSDFSSPIQDVTVPGTFANGSVQTVNPAALARGGTYYVRVQAADASVWGNWSTTFQFKVASLPTVTVSEPSAAGRLALITYSAGSGWVTPRMVVNWGFSCPDGGSQYSYRVEVANDASGSPGGYLNDSTTLVDSATRSRVIPQNLTEGAYYHVQVTATCSHGLSQTVTYRRVRTRWGVVTHQYDMGAAVGSLALTALDVTDQSNGGQGQVVVEYMTGSTTALPATWAANIGGAGLNRYLNYRTWLLIWGASPAVSPTLNELKVTYPSATATIIPDKWQFQDAANETGDISAYVYGTKSLKLSGKGTTHWASQQVAVAPNTNYMLSGRIQSQGNSGAYMDLATAHAGTSLIATPAKTASIGFEDPNSRVFPIDGTGKPQPWFSGNNTSVWVRCIVTGAVGATAWFDALKLEASTVVTPWSPGYVANAVILDAGGLQIDASNGGIFRLRGAAGGIRDLVELGNNGLRFGGDTELSSGAPNQLNTPGSLVPASGLYTPFAYAGSGNVLKINGTGTSGGQWFRIASGTLFAQYTNQVIRGLLLSRYSVVEVEAAIAADAGVTVQPTPVRVKCRTLVHSDGQVNAKVIVTGVNPITWQLWAQAPGAYSHWEWFPYAGVTESLPLPVIENPSTYGWVATGSLPAGTQYNSVAGIDGDFAVGGAFTGAGATLSGPLTVNNSANAQGIYESGVRLIQPAGLRILTGSVTTTHSNAQVSNQVGIAFSPVFSGVPFVACLCHNFNYFGGANGNAPTASGFTYATYRASGVATASITSTWIAIGPA